MAVHEAGFEPNKMTTALDDAFLIEKYVGLVRKLNGAPTAQEMRFERAKSDAAFRLPRPTGDLGRTI